MCIHMISSTLHIISDLALYELNAIYQHPEGSRPDTK